MTTTIITIITSILAYQLLTTLIFIISDENDDVLVTVSCGPWKYVAMFVCAVIGRIRLHMHRKYNVYAFYGKCSESKWDSKSDKWITNYYMTPEIAAQFRQVAKNDVPVDYCIKLIRVGKEFKSIPMKEEILTQERIDAGVPGMSVEFFKKFMKEEGES